MGLTHTFDLLMVLGWRYELPTSLSCNEGLSKAVTGAKIDYHSTSRRALMEAEGNG